MAASLSKEEPNIIKNLIDLSYTKNYLNLKLSQIINEPFDKFDIEILHYYQDSVRWIINIYHQKEKKKIIAISNPGAPKNYLISKFFLKNDKGVSTYKPLFYDENNNLFFYEYISGRTFRELVEIDKITFPSAEAKVLPTIEILKKMSFITADIALNRIDFAAEIEKFSREFPNTDIDWQNFKEKFKAVHSGTSQIVHGDFQPGNLISNSKINIIDWDKAFLGDNAYDIGTFLAHTDLMFEYHYGEQESEKFKKIVLNSFSDQIKKITLAAAFVNFTIADFLSKNPNNNSELVNKIIQKAERYLDEQ